MPPASRRASAPTWNTPCNSRRVQLEGTSDSDGKEVAPTPDLVARAHAWYRAKLLATLPSAKKAEFARFDKQLGDAIQADGQARLIVQHRALEWLAGNANKATVDTRTIGKSTRCAGRSTSSCPTARTRRISPSARSSSSIRTSATSLTSPPLKLGGDGIQVFLATTNSGPAYFKECTADGVPSGRYQAGGRETQGRHRRCLHRTFDRARLLDASALRQLQPELQQSARASSCLR